MKRTIMIVAAVAALTGCASYADRLADQGWRNIGGDIDAKCDGPNMVYRASVGVAVVANDKRCTP